ncbi:MAG: electron transfer flavoprotein subunit alpha/FixB family protein, partial [Pseudomonadota bacterium]
KSALVFIEEKNGQIKKSSLECLSVLVNSDMEISTCSIGSGTDALKDQLGAWGVKKHYACTDDSAKVYNPENYQNILSHVFNEVKPQMFLASSNSIGRDVFPRLAAEMDAAYMSDVTEMTTDGAIKRPLYAGKCSAQVSFTDDSTKIVLLRPNQIPVADASRSETTEAVAVSLPAASGKSQTLSVEQGESEKLDLTEADKIVSGGRGLKEADNFKILDQLAEPIGATVGASRAVVDLGWVPHSLQVGQTGKTVAPSLYFAVGISGAIQHLAGMSGSKNIVAINKDEKAPIFQKATYGVVGDLFEVVPLLTEKLKSLQ